MIAESFLPYLTSEKRYSPHTAEAYLRDLEQFSNFCKKEFELDEPSSITTEVVRSWLAFLLDHGMAVPSVHRKLSSVNSYFRFLQRKGLCEANPAKAIPKPKRPARLPLFIEESATEKIYKDPHLSDSADAFVSLRDTLLIKLLYETGIRQAELLNLRDQDVDPYLQQIKVVGKRNKTRLVPVSKDLLENIKTYLAMRDERFSHKNFESLLVTNTGKKNTKSFVYKTVKSYLSAITTIKKKSPHILRHTFATHMLNNGADLNAIKEILGHSSLAATQVYTHNHIDKLRRIHAQAHPRNKKSP